MNSKLSFVIVAVIVTLLSLTGMTQSNANILDGFKLYYSFANGTPHDLSGNKNHGTNNGAKQSNGRTDYGMLFDGNDFIKVKNSSSLNFGTGDFSVACWIKVESDTNGKIIDKKASTHGVGYSLEIWNGVPLLQVNDPKKGFFNYYTRKMTPINDGKWHHIAVSIDRDSSTGVKIYLDAQLITKQNARYRPGSLSNDGVLYIGRRMDGRQQFKGVLDELRIYGRVVTEDEVDTLYRNDTGVVLPPITGGTNGGTTRYWDCCKPNCAWSGKATYPVQSCNLSGNSLGDNFKVASVCNKGEATLCASMAPRQVGPNVSYGYAASNQGKCGDCYQLDFKGSLAGKSMIVQVINIADSAPHYFNILIPGGGLDANTEGCSRQFPNVDWGTKYGGWAVDCNYSAKCVRSKCNKAFDDNPKMLEGCLWYVDWFETANNPEIVYAPVECPAELR